MSVFVRPAAIDGKEIVFGYQISVGKEIGGLFKPEFIIDITLDFSKRCQSRGRHKAHETTHMPEFGA